MTQITVFIFINFFLITWAVSSSAQVQRQTDSTLFFHHSILGRKFLPKSQGADKAFFADELLFSVQVSTDNYGRRTTRPHPQKNHSQSMVFLGDSMTMGAGVEDHQTLPSQMARLYPEHNVYNYALGGWGPTHSLIDLKERDLSDEIKEPQSKAFYIHYEFLIYRSIPKPASLHWGQHHPFMRQDGHVVSFQTQRPWLFHWLEWMDDWPWLQAVANNRWLNRLSEKEIHYYVDIIKKMKEEYEQSLGKDHRFHLVLVGQTDPKLKKHLLALPGSIDLTHFHYTEEETFLYDGHPKPAGHQRLAKELKAVLDNRLN